MFIHQPRSHSPLIDFEKNDSLKLLTFLDIFTRWSCRISTCILEIQ
jgi:hypothetical protein